MTNTSNLTIRIPAELHDQLTTLAEAAERSRNWVVQKALESYVQENAWQIERIQVGIDAADKGDLIPHDEVFAGLADKIKKRLEQS